MVTPASKLLLRLPADMPPSFNIAIVAHYFPPINSSGAKRFEAMTKYFAREGHRVAVFTTCKTGADGEFSESIPNGVEVFELGPFGRLKPSVQGEVAFEDMYATKPSLKRRIKGWSMDLLGQLPDPRLPFALAFSYPWLDRSVCARLRECDVVIGTCPPWPMLLGALVISRRFGPKAILDYRDPFSDCHEMPGGRMAKAIERTVDRLLARRAAAVVAISEPIAMYYRHFHDEVSVIMNGYDHEVVEAAERDRAWATRATDSPVIVRYMGLVSPGRVPHRLLEALVDKVSRDPWFADKVRFEYYGPGDVMHAALAAKYPTIAGMFAFYANVPYRRALGLAITADYLLFCETSQAHNLSAQGILTTKLFEYIATGRPIIAEIHVRTLAGSLIRQANEDHLVTTSGEDFKKLLSSAVFLSPRESRQSAIAPSLSRQFAAHQYLGLIERVIAPAPAISSQEFSHG